MKYIPYTDDDDYKRWVKESKRKKRKNKQFSSKVHKNLNSK
jgi:hypothetical protein